ncbi:MAG: hypothetical protein ACKVG0_08865 [Alphaproteobacteria bacterium]
MPFPAGPLLTSRLYVSGFRLLLASAHIVGSLLDLLWGSLVH